MTNFIVSASLLALLVLLANPLGFWMPTALAYMTVAALAVVGALYTGLLYKESSRDEREKALRGSAARVGYLTGILILILGIAIPVLQGGQPSPWVIGAIAAMVIARITSRVISE